MAGLAFTETVSWGVLYYTFSVFLQPLQAETGWSRSAISGAFSLALLTSALAAPWAGRVLDRHGARGLMTAGSLAAALLVAAFSRVTQLATLYLVWAALGVTMAAVLYEPAFAVICRRLEGAERRRALTAVTLLAGLASTIFVPLASALLAACGWRTAALLLAAGLALLTVPVHAHVLRGSAPEPLPSAAPRRAPGALRTGSFWTLTGAFVLAGLVSAAVGVHAVACFASRGFTPAQAGALVAALGFMQLPARLAFVPLASRLPPAVVAPVVFALPALGLAGLLAPPGTAGVVLFVVAFGMGNGLATLVRATVVADVFGAEDYGTLAGVMAGPVTAARAAGPLLVARLYDAQGSYELAVPVLLALAVVAALVMTAWAAAPWRPLAATPPSAA